MDLSKLMDHLCRLVAEHAWQQQECTKRTAGGVLGVSKQLHEGLMAARPAQANPTPAIDPQVTD